MKKHLLVLISALLIAGCRANNTSSSISTTSQSQSSNTSESTSITSSVTSQSSATSSSKTTTSSSSHSSSTKPTSSSTTTTTGSQDDYMKGRPLLPNGYAQIDAPTNSPVQLVTSTSSQDWYNVDWTQDQPSNWRYIYKNSVDNGPSGHKCSPGFYSYNPSKPNDYPGGLKFTNPFIGFQSMKFTHTGEKLEIRIYITQVNNATDQPDEKNPTGYLYFFRNNGDLIPSLTYTIEKGSIVTKTEYVKCYITGSEIKNVTHFQFWTQAKPYKGSQCYNFGVGQVGIHSWTYE